ncbi:MAG: CpsD/CapB family tyrosine-protein kinase [Lachnospiraceae bacterium]|nr:CpsD/CapB family tyrosine-protein kinase [Lachnospiraceae bacterium]
MQDIIIGKLKKLDYASEEEYKSLRTNLQFCGKEVKVIGITSCIPNEGKSSVAINIARSIAETGKKVLLVDCDMRKSVLVGRHRITKASNGLSHFLSGYRELDESLCQTNIPNLYMILAGPIPPNPSELLGSTIFKNFIRAAKEKFDYVILDTPPLGSVIDAAVVSQLCDGMCLVLTAGKISYKFAQKIKEQLDMANCRILGVIMNKVKVRKNGYYGKYYGKYYGSYYARDNGGK